MPKRKTPVYHGAKAVLTRPAARDRFLEPHGTEEYDVLSTNIITCALPINVMKDRTRCPSRTKKGIGGARVHLVEVATCKPTRWLDGNKTHLDVPKKRASSATLLWGMRHVRPSSEMCPRDGSLTGHAMILRRERLATICLETIPWKGLFRAEWEVNNRAHVSSCWVLQRARTRYCWKRIEATREKLKATIA